MSPSYRHVCDLFWYRLTAGIASLCLLAAGQASLESRSNDSPAQSSSHADMAMATDIKVDANRIRFGNEFVPRRTDLPSTLIVSRGQSVELPEDATYDYIEVAGTLSVSR